MSYKEKARSYFSAVNQYDVDKIESMVDENYIQHNPLVPTGRAAFLSLIPKLKQFGSKITNVRMLGDGQHVIMHHRWQNGAPFGSDNLVAFHIIRFDTKELIAEHWSIMREDVDFAVSGKSLSDGSVEVSDLHKTDENKACLMNLFKNLISPSGESLSDDVSSFFEEDFLKADFDESIIKYLKQHKVFGEGNFSLSISEAIYQEAHCAVYDLFRLNGGRIVEHWRITQEIPTKNLVNQNTMFGFEF